MSKLAKNKHGGARKGAGNFAEEPMATYPVYLPIRVIEWLKTQPRGEARRILEGRVPGDFKIDIAP